MAANLTANLVAMDLRTEDQAQLTTATHILAVMDPDSQHSGPASSPSPWDRLPTELRLRILYFTHLGPGGDYAPEHIPLLIKGGRLSKWASAAPAQATDCPPRKFPVELFLVNSQMRDLAEEVFYSENVFVFEDVLIDNETIIALPNSKSYGKPALDFLKRLPPRVLPLIRRIELNMGETCDIVEDFEARRDTWVLMTDDWDELMTYIGQNLNLPRLHITLNFRKLYDWESWELGINEAGEFPHNGYRAILTHVVGSMCALARGEDGLGSVGFDMPHFGWYLEDWLAREVLGPRYRGPLPRCEGWTPDRLQREGAELRIEESNFGADSRMWLFEGMDTLENARSVFERNVLEELGLE